jgi:hypothetical protein
MRYFKYIVYKENNQIKVHFGYVSFHKDLLPSKPLNYRGYWEFPECLGGGMFILSFDSKTITLYGDSSDFGKVKSDILNNVINTQKDKIFNDLWYACHFASKDDEKYDLDDDYSFDDWKIKII